MKTIIHSGNSYVLCFERGDELMERITEFCSAEGIAGGFFRGIGAAQETTISWYDIEAKAYKDRVFLEPLEIVSLTGNIALLNGKQFIHAHAVFSDANMRAYGGHVKKIIVSATCEVLLEPESGKMDRGFAEEVGLNLLQ